MWTWRKVEVSDMLKLQCMLNFDRKASAIHLNVSFLELRKVMSLNISEQIYVHQLASCKCLYLYWHIRRVPVLCCKWTVDSWLLQMYQPLSLTEAAEPGGGERWRDNGNGGRKKASTIFNEFPWLSLPVSGSGSLWLSVWVDSGLCYTKERLSQGLLIKSLDLWRHH